MAIVNCPECSKKLKVADTSIGKKVKCSCGAIFVATEAAAAEAAPPAAAASMAEKVLVACTECASKLKVATTSLGKKMKCPRCGGIFVAALPALARAEETMPMPPPKSPPAGPSDEEEPLNFAAAQTEDDDQFEEEAPKPKAKPRRKPVDEDEPSELAPAPAGKPVYPSRLLVNLFVVLLVLAYGAFFALAYPGFSSPPLLDLGLVKDRTIKPIQLPGVVPPLGMPQPKGGPAVKIKTKKDQGDKETSKKDEPKKDESKGGVPAKLGASPLEGTWNVVSAEEFGKTQERNIGETFTFSQGKFKSPDGSESTYRLDTTKDPIWLDIEVPKVGAIPGIIKIEGDSLHWVFAGPGKEEKVGPRPTTFDSKGGIYMVLKRGTKDAPAIPPGRDSQKNLKQMALAMHNYHDANTTFPPAALSDASGKPLLSWRVAILPYLEEVELYQEFDLTKPWDDPHNKKLIAKMPKIYVVPGTDGSAGKTHYRALVGPGTVLEPLKGPRGKLIGRTLVAIPDGTANTIMIVEAKEPIEWTRPDDLPYDPKGPLPKFGVNSKGFNVAMADGSVRFIPADVPENILRPYLTGNNGMPREPLEAGPGKKDQGLDKEKSAPRPSGKKEAESEKKPPTEPDKDKGPVKDQGRLRVDGMDQPAAQATGYEVSARFLDAWPVASFPDRLMRSPRSL